MAPASPSASSCPRVALPLHRSDLAVPDVAWPTLLLLATALLGVLVLSPALPVWWLSLPCSTWCIFAIFTPVHDAVHGAVSSAHPWLNGLVGRIGGVVFFAPFPAFRHVHLLHHKHTNDPKKDPDYWSGSGPTLLKPLRWVSQELHYYVPYFADVPSLPLANSLESILTVVTSWSSIIYLVGWSPWSSAVIWYWLIPHRVAVFFLAFTFDYVPHRPHQISSAQDPYRSTSKISGVFRAGDCNLDWPLLYQNYHNIHHLYPSVPFYRYSRIWHQHSAQLQQLHTPVVPLYSPKTPWW